MVRQTVVSWAARVGVVAVLLGSGCAGAGHTRNDPETRGAATLGIGLSLDRLGPRVRGTGVLRVRLMPVGIGEAVEARVEWVRQPGRAVSLLPRLRGRADTMVFEDLAPDGYRLDSFALSARYERPGRPPLQVSLAGVFEEVEAVRVGAGELCDLGRLALRVQPDRSFVFQVERGGAGVRLATTGAAYADLAGHRRVVRAARGGNAPSLPTPRPGRSGPASARGSAPAVPAGESGKAPVGMVALGLQLRAHGVLTHALEGGGRVRISLRRVGAGDRSAPLEARWNLKGAPSAPAASRYRPVVLSGDGTHPLANGGVALWASLPPGAYEILEVRITGTLRDAEEGERPVGAAAIPREPIPFEVVSGVAADLGALRIDLRGRARASLSSGGGGDLARVEAARAAGRIPPEMRGIARPVRAGRGVE